MKSTEAIRQYLNTNEKQYATDAANYINKGTEYVGEAGDLLESIE